MNLLHSSIPLTISSPYICPGVKSLGAIKHSIFFFSKQSQIFFASLKFLDECDIKTSL